MAKLGISMISAHKVFRVVKESYRFRSIQPKPLNDMKRLGERSVGVFADEEKAPIEGSDIF